MVEVLFCIIANVVMLSYYMNGGKSYENHSLTKACNEKELEDAKAEGRAPEVLPHFSCHHLRHTFCTRFCENETNLKIIQEIMGRADITTTMDIYNEATKEKKIESFAALEEKIKIR